MIVIKDLVKIYHGKFVCSSLKERVLNFKKYNKNAKLIQFSNLKLINNLNLTVEEGKILGIIGPNGAGKSTLAKLIAGTVQPTSGSISVFGKIVPFLELGVAFNNELSGLDNLYLNGVLLGLSLSYLIKNKEAIFDFAGVKNFMKMPLKFYSSGMQLRLAFSIAMHAKGDIYIFDEILAVGDSNFQKKCMDSFENLVKAKKTILIVSHDLQFLLQHVDELLYIDKNFHYLITKKEDLAGILNIEDLQNRMSFI